MDQGVQGQVPTTPVPGAPHRLRSPVLEDLRRRVAVATKPVRARAAGALERLEPSADSLMRGWPALAPVPLGVALVYRRRNAHLVTDLLAGVPAGARVALWALDEVAPDLAPLTRGTGPGMRIALLNRLVADLDLPAEAWVLLADDDVRLQRGTVADLLRAARSLGLDVSQPGHSHRSTHKWKVNEHRFLTWARSTRFVETGPLLLLSPRAVQTCLPVDERFVMGIGSEAVWGGRPELRLGVLDCLTMLHLGPVGAAYDGLAEWAATEHLVQDLLRPVGLTSLFDLQRQTGRWWWTRPRPGWARPEDARGAGPATAGAPPPQLRVLLVEPDLSDNGAVRVSLDRAARWQRVGCAVTVAVLNPRRPAHPAQVPEALAVARVRSLDGPKAVRRPLALARLARRARGSDVVVSSREVEAGLVSAWLVARLTRRPFAVTVQSRPDLGLEHVPRALRLAYRAALRRADLAVCVAAGLVEPVVALGLPRERVRVVTNGVDVAGVRAAARHDPELALPTGPLVVASGRLAHAKGFDLLVRAHALALQEGAPPHSVVVLGEGPAREELQDLAAALGVGGSFLLPGWAVNPFAVLARADLFCLPSRWEGYPLALVEALCLGIPCVAADCVSGPSEVLDQDRYGRLVPVEDVPALAQALTQHLRDPEDLRRRSQEGSDAAVRRFDAQRAADAHLALLAGLARAPRPTRSRP